MENQLFERDYRNSKQVASDLLSVTTSALFDELKNADFFQKVAEAFSQVPKVVLPEAKADYEYLLAKCDAFAKQHGGIIRGKVDYENYEAVIDLHTPFFEIDYPNEKEFMTDIVNRSTYFCFQPDGNGWTRLHIFFTYFTDVMSAEDKATIIEQAAEDMGPEFLNKLEANSKLNSLVTGLYEAGAYGSTTGDKQGRTAMEESSILARHIKYYREQHGKSQEELASEWNFPTSQIALLESGTADPELSILRQIAGFMGITVSALLRDG